MSADPRVDAYIAKQADFARPILAELRRRLHAACPEVVETIKWSHPSFTYKGRILAGMAAFKAHATFGFWEREGTDRDKESEAMGQFGRLTALDQLPGDAEFAEMARTVMRRMDAPAPPKPRPAPKEEAEVPPDLSAALAGDEAASAVFDGFPPSCRREYCEWVAEAKRPETRAKRLAQTIEWLREGKRRNWKYENC